MEQRLEKPDLLDVSTLAFLPVVIGVVTFILSLPEWIPVIYLYMITAVTFSLGLVTMLASGFLIKFRSGLTRLTKTLLIFGASMSIGSVFLYLAHPWVAFLQ